ncbi:hypothetical protein Hanom_Chr12g01091131 [Helianthus anomalus]
MIKRLIATLGELRIVIVATWGLKDAYIIVIFGYLLSLASCGQIFG